MEDAGKITYVAHNYRLQNKSKFELSDKRNPLKFNSNEGGNQNSTEGERSTNKEEEEDEEGINDRS